MNSLITRIISAIVAIAVVISLYVFFGADGMRALVFIAPLLGVRELNRILFQTKDSTFIRILFFLFVLGIFVVAAKNPEYSTVAFACFAIFYCSASILYEHRFDDLTSLSLFQAKSILGFFYVGLLPAMAYRLLDLEKGEQWFFTMLAVVFAGDTLAFATGILWGDKKILPNISPKKTVVGSFGGLAGSLLAAVICQYFWFPEVPFWAMAILGVVTGAVAQLGDLFESMLKRVANIKDSGTIMPGHGGILDRLDGVLFGAPIMLFGALVLESMF